MNKTNSRKIISSPQKLLVFQQNGSGEGKISGVRRYGGNNFLLDVVSIDEHLPAVIDDTACYLPDDLDAQLVLDFLKHPDLSSDLINLCIRKKIPVVASGKKSESSWPHTPAT